MKDLYVIISFCELEFGGKLFTSEENAMEWLENADIHWFKETGLFLKELMFDGLIKIIKAEVIK